MSAIQLQPHLTFEEFLDYDTGTENLYELIDGSLIAMSEPSRLHQRIARYLDLTFGDEIERLELPWEPVRNTAIKVPGRNLADGRRPDLAIVTIPQTEEESQTKGIHTTPHMIVEIASSNWGEDLKRKVLAYAHLEVPEYWVIDYGGQIPEKHCDRGKGVKTIVYTLQGYGYVKQEFVGDELIPCRTFPEVKLTTNLVVRAGK
ncbi:Uma2 family endonuclease [Leptolyngbya sp. FACHB-671]|uniref:Uma2 family endonuclease n=1 Tax=Leptolyngbya sp. FACHB-671 TaxID=2692812 RepID=UPI00168600E3|nr:Uma2 family endonuclease [Leptolyngbya sp. FACHB-671]MBD2072092.1 Uma2 family endonuclease [Leptolyngbya sp. FACHB-671]